MYTDHNRHSPKIPCTSIFRTTDYMSAMILGIAAIDGLTLCEPCEAHLRSRGQVELNWKFHGKSCSLKEKVGMCGAQNPGFLEILRFTLNPPSDTWWYMIMSQWGKIWSNRTCTVRNHIGTPTQAGNTATGRNMSIKGKLVTKIIFWV
jgi:hypothetical protein